MRETAGASYINDSDQAGVYILGNKPGTEFFEEADEPLVASDRRCAEVYSALLEELDLDEWSYENITERGLNDNEIEILSYKSTVRMNEVMKRLLRLELKLDNVPGFYMKDKKWRANAPPGFFIPIRNREGKIRRLQIRTPYDDPKYVWFSSERDREGNPHQLGAGSGSPVHYRTTDDKILWINEAPLKADYAWLKSKQTWSCVGSAGVGNAHEELAEETLNPQYELAVIAADGNWRSNSQVARAVARLYRRIQRTSGLTTEVGVWDSQGGIDEALKNNLKLYRVGYDRWFSKLSEDFQDAIRRDEES